MCVYALLDFGLGERSIVANPSVTPKHTLHRPRSLAGAFERIRLQRRTVGLEGARCQEDEGDEEIERIRVT